MKSLFSSLFLSATLSLAACGENNNNDPELCDDGVDNDQDGDTDLDDAADCPSLIIEGLSTPESAFFDATSNAWYVSNQGQFFTNGDGFITKLDANGKVVNQSFVTGLNDPRGIRVDGSSLFVSDITDLVEIDLSNGQVVSRVALPNAVFLNDVAIDPANGDVYVSDTFTNTIFRVVAGVPEVFLSDAALEAPNGLLIEGGTLLLNGLGPDLDPNTFQTSAPGQLQEIDLATQTITPSNNRLGGLDGLERDGQNILTTNFLGQLFSVDAQGNETVLLDTADGLTNSADIGFDASRRIVAIPDSGAGKLFFFDLDQL